MTGWIKHSGNGCPLVEGTMIDVEYRDGEIIYNVPANDFAPSGRDASPSFWVQEDENNDIVAYRIVQEAPKTIIKPSEPIKSLAGIGDVNSDAKGAGARYNAGKAPLELIPLRLIVEERRKVVGSCFEAELIALEALAMFQEGAEVDVLYDAIIAIGSQWDECAKVFDYGRRKYADWNWAKGMPWSVPIACAARHILFGVMQGEENDVESGLPHRGHFLCNIVMLLTYAMTYPEGDDRPKQWLKPMLEQ